MPIEDASIAQAFSALVGEAAEGRCSSTGSGVVRPGELDAAAAGRCPACRSGRRASDRRRRDSACASHQAVEVLPLVPVTASTSQLLRGLAVDSAAIGPVAAFSCG